VTILSIDRFVSVCLHSKSCLSVMFNHVTILTRKTEMSKVLPYFIPIWYNNIIKEYNLILI